MNSLSGGDKGTELTKLAQNFGRLEDGFIELLKIDQKERIEMEQIRNLDRTKHTLSVCNYLHLGAFRSNLVAINFVFRGNMQDQTERS